MWERGIKILTWSLEEIFISLSDSSPLTLKRRRQQYCIQKDVFFMKVRWSIKDEDKNWQQCLYPFFISFLCSTEFFFSFFFIGCAGGWEMRCEWKKLFQTATTLVNGLSICVLICEVHIKRPIEPFYARAMLKSNSIFHLCEVVFFIKEQKSTKTHL